MLKLAAGNAQTVPATAASQMIASLSPGAAEVARLAQSGVGDDVILAYIGQSQGFYNLAAADITVLKNDGVSSQAVTAMLNHDGSLRTRQAASTVSSPVSMPAVAPPSTTTQSAAVTPPTTANTTVVVQSTPPPPQVEVVPVSPVQTICGHPVIGLGTAASGFGLADTGTIHHNPAISGSAGIGVVTDGTIIGLVAIGGNDRSAAFVGQTQPLKL